MISEQGTPRGQLVLLAAIALAVALVPLVLAYLQLGYHDDIHATPEPTDPTQQADRTLEHTLHNETADLAMAYSWSERTVAVTTVRDRLDPTLDAIRQSGLDAGTVTFVEYNQTRAEAWAATDCPGGEGRQFGPCEADRGIILQERGDQTHVLGAAFDLESVTPDADIQLTVVIERKN